MARQAIFFIKETGTVQRRQIWPLQRRAPKKVHIQFIELYSNFIQIIIPEN